MDPCRAGNIDEAIPSVNVNIASLLVIFLFCPWGVSVNAVSMHNHILLVEGAFAVFGLDVLLIDFVDFGCAWTQVQMLDEYIESAGGALGLSDDLVC